MLHTIYSDSATEKHSFLLRSKSSFQQALADVQAAHRHWNGNNDNPGSGCEKIDRTHFGAEVGST